MRSFASNTHGASGDVAISARGISKSYRIAHQAKNDRLGEVMMQRLRRPWSRLERETFWALDEVSFDVPRGEVLGIVGRNGAGKSTLLKILSQIVEPTHGTVDIYGRVGSLLEVGTGFHPELTGRENIFLNGALLGMRRQEIARKFDEIVDFAEVERFLDTPVKRYSSGMYVRLAFAIAAHLNPEILIVDEVLAVGDAAFQQKCLNKMQEVATDEGRTVLFVSHNITAVSSLCSSAILLEGGKLTYSGEVEDVLEKYAGKAVVQSRVELHTHPDRAGNSQAVFQSLELRNEAGEATHIFDAGNLMSICFDLVPPRSIPAPKLNMGINNWRGDRVFSLSSAIGGQSLPPMDEPVAVTAHLQLPALLPGLYSIDISVHDTSIDLNDYIPKAAAFEIAPDEYLGAIDVTNPRLMGFVVVKPEWHVASASTR